jgi:hypothetical protein
VIRDKVLFEAEKDEEVREIEKRNQAAERRRLKQTEALHKWKKRRHEEFVERQMRNKSHQEFMLENQKKEYQLELLNELLDKEEMRQERVKEERKRQKKFKKLDREYERKKMEAELKDLEKRQIYSQALNEKMKKSESQMRKNQFSILKHKKALSTQRSQ